MNQQQSIGSNNQQEGLPGNSRQQKTASPNKMRGEKQQPEKPAVTDDAGNPLDKQFTEAGNGYSEKKPTEPGSEIKKETKGPSQQSGESEKVYGKNTNPPNENLRNQTDFPHQLNQEEKDACEKRIRQSENVAG